MREVEAFRAQVGRGRLLPAGLGRRLAARHLLRQHLRPEGAAALGMETLSLHEASPGHHFQIVDPAGADGAAALSPLRRRLHRVCRGLGAVRRVSRQGAGSVHRSVPVLRPPQRRAAARDAARRRHGSAREGLDAASRRSSTCSTTPRCAESDVESEVERYIAWPGQALGYKVGDLRIQALRRKAETSLGAKFDVRDFHREVLSDGAVPMDVLERKIDRWIEARR